MSTPVEEALARFEPIGLDELDRCAQLLTRKDRKYIVDPDDLVGVMSELSGQVKALEMSAGRWSGYRSVYFDTDRFDSFRMAALKRRKRFKVRTRCYVDSDKTMVEVKTKDSRGRTVKRRCTLDPAAGPVDESVRHFARRFEELEPFADALRPNLESTYRRATLVVPELSERFTIDIGYGVADACGRTTGFDRSVIVETKTNGAASELDRLLWRAGYRPVKFSKYATAVAALNPGLPSNRWHRLITAHFASPHTRQLQETSP